MVASVNIKNGEKKDAGQILELQYLSYQSEALLYNDHTIPPLTQSLEDLVSSFKDHLFLNAVKSNKIVGSVRARQEKETCHIGRLIVHPEYQGRGIGTSLLTAIEESFPNTPRFELFTGTKSLRNLSLYTRLGYTRFKTENLSDKITLTFLEKYR